MKNLSLPEIRAAAVILLRPEGTVLIAQRTANKTIMPGYWEFPGGKLEAGETPETAMIREAQEELGITPVTYSPLTFLHEARETGSPDAYCVTVYVYLCTGWDGEPTAREGQPLAWVMPEKLHDYPLLPANRSLVELLRNR